MLDVCKLLAHKEYIWLTMETSELEYDSEDLDPQTWPKKFDQDLFVNIKGNPISFVLYCEFAADIQRIIKRGGGVVAREPNGLYSIVLCSPCYIIPEGHQVYDVNYIRVCCTNNRLMDINQYRLKNGKPLYRADFNVMDVLHQRTTWPKAVKFLISQQEETRDIGEKTLSFPEKPPPRSNKMCKLAQRHNAISEEFPRRNQTKLKLNKPTVSVTQINRLHVARDNGHKYRRARHHDDIESDTVSETSARKWNEERLPSSECSERGDSEENQLYSSRENDYTRVRRRDIYPVEHTSVYETSKRSDEQYSPQYRERRYADSRNLLYVHGHKRDKRIRNVSSSVSQSALSTAPYPEERREESPPQRETSSRRPYVGRHDVSETLLQPTQYDSYKKKYNYHSLSELPHSKHRSPAVKTRSTYSTHKVKRKMYREGEPETSQHRYVYDKAPIPGPSGCTSYHHAEQEQYDTYERIQSSCTSSDEATMVNNTNVTKREQFFPMETYNSIRNKPRQGSHSRRRYTADDSVVSHRVVDRKIEAVERLHPKDKSTEVLHRKRPLQSREYARYRRCSSADDWPDGHSVENNDRYVDSIQHSDDRIGSVRDRYNRMAADKSERYDNFHQTSSVSRSNQVAELYHNDHIPALQPRGSPKRSNNFIHRNHTLIRGDQPPTLYKNTQMLESSDDEVIQTFPSKESTRRGRNINNSKATLTERDHYDDSLQDQIIPRKKPFLVSLDNKSIPLQSKKTAKRGSSNFNNTIRDTREDSDDWYQAHTGPRNKRIVEREENQHVKQSSVRPLSSRKYKTYQRVPGHDTRAERQYVEVNDSQQSDESIDSSLQRKINTKRAAHQLRGNKQTLNSRDDESPSLLKTKESTTRSRVLKHDRINASRSKSKSPPCLPIKSTSRSAQVIDDEKKSSVVRCNEGDSIDPEALLDEMALPIKSNSLEASTGNKAASTSAKDKDLTVSSANARENVDRVVSALSPRGRPKNRKRQLYSHNKSISGRWRSNSESSAKESNSTESLKKIEDEVHCSVTKENKETTRNEKAHHLNELHSERADDKYDALNVTEGRSETSKVRQWLDSCSSLSKTQHSGSLAKESHSTSSNNIVEERQSNSLAQQPEKVTSNERAHCQNDSSSTNSTVYEAVDDGVDVAEMAQGRSGTSEWPYKKKISKNIVRATDSSDEQSLTRDKSRDRENNDDVWLSSAEKPKRGKNQRQISNTKVTQRAQENSDSMSDDSANIVDLNKPKLKRRQKNTARRDYTLEEKRAIIDYIVRNNCYDRVKGREIWQLMADFKICRNRTWQSMKEHFVKQIIPLITCFNLSKEEVKRFKEPFR